MAGKPKPTPLDAFRININDAHWLLETARIFANRRVRRMRKEMRNHAGEMLDVPERERGLLDCTESNDLFIIIKPEALVGRQHMRDLSPLLRQSVVAGCAALETYVADAVIARIGPVVRDEDTLPTYVGKIT